MFGDLSDYLCCWALSAGEMTTYTMEELKRISSLGTRAPVYVLCLKELKRLKQVEGSANTSVYELVTAKE